MSAGVFAYFCIFFKVNSGRTGISSGSCGSEIKSEKSDFYSEWIIQPFQKTDQ